MTHYEVEERLRKGQSIFERATLDYIESLKRSLRIAMGQLTELEAKNAKRKVKDSRN